MPAQMHRWGKGEVCSRTPSAPRATRLTPVPNADRRHHARTPPRERNPGSISRRFQRRRTSHNALYVDSGRGPCWRVSTSFSPFSPAHGRCASSRAPCALRSSRSRRAIRSAGSHTAASAFHVPENRFRCGQSRSSSTTPPLDSCSARRSLWSGAGHRKRANARLRVRRTMFGRWVSSRHSLAADAQRAQGVTLCLAVAVASDRAVDVEIASHSTPVQGR
jgi:hypothetical protein